MTQPSTSTDLRFGQPVTDGPSPLTEGLKQTGTASNGLSGGLPIAEPPTTSDTQSGISSTFTCTRGKKRKSKNLETGRGLRSKKEKQAHSETKDSINSFWEAHYRLDAQACYPVQDVFDFFTAQLPNSAITFDTFRSVSGTLGFRTQRTKHSLQPATYGVSPTSLLSLTHHEGDTGLQPAAPIGPQPGPGLNGNNTDDGRSINTGPDTDSTGDPAPHTGTEPSTTTKTHSTPNTRKTAQEARANLSAFWNAHYDLKNPTRELPAHEVHAFFETTKWTAGQSLNQFIFQSTAISNLSSKRSNPSIGRVYKVSPKSRLAHQHHMDIHDLPPAPSSLPLPPTSAPLLQPQQRSKVAARQIHLYQANMRGLVTEERNKCSAFREIFEAGSSGVTRIVGITDTWAQAHMDAEFSSGFKDYNILRVDRDTALAETDDEAISCQGGVMLLTTTDRFQGYPTEILKC